MLRDAYNWMPSQDWHWLQIFPVQPHLGAPPIHNKLGYSQLMTYQCEPRLLRSQHFYSWVRMRMSNRLANTMPSTPSSVIPRYYTAPFKIRTTNLIFQSGGMVIITKRQLKFHSNLSIVGNISSFAQLFTNVANTNSLTTPHPCQSLFDLAKRGWCFENELMSIHYLDSSS